MIDKLAAVLKSGLKQLPLQGGEMIRVVQLKMEAAILRGKAAQDPITRGRTLYFQWEESLRWWCPLQKVGQIGQAVHISPGIPKPIPRAKNRESAALKQNRDSVASNDSFNDSPLPLNPASAQQLVKVAAETEELALFSTRYSMSNGWKMMVISFV